MNLIGPSSNTTVLKGAGPRIRIQSANSNSKVTVVSGNKVKTVTLTQDMSLDFVA